MEERIPQDAGMRRNESKGSVMVGMYEEGMKSICASGNHVVVETIGGRYQSPGAVETGTRGAATAAQGEQTAYQVDAASAVRSNAKRQIVRMNGGGRILGQAGVAA